MTASFFLRFYGQPRDVIKQCIDELAPVGLVDTVYAPMTTSCNPIIPRGENTEVKLIFKTKKNVEVFMKDPTTHTVYMKYAVSEAIDPAKEATFALRKPNDMAFSVRS